MFLNPDSTQRHAASVIMGPNHAVADDRIGQIPPPDGETPDFDHPRDAGRIVNIVGLSVCSFLITFFFFIRAYVRIFINRRILPSDYACFLGWYLTLVYAGTLFGMIHWGLGYYAWEVTPHDYTEVLKWLYAGSIVYIPAAYCVKVTILLLIARVFAVRERVAKGVKIFIVMLTLAYIPVQTLKTFVCTPIRAYWEPLSVPMYGCLDQRKLFITDLALAVVADLVIVLTPVPITWSLRLPLRKKLKIIFMLGCGGLATGVTFFRLAKVILFLDSRDVTHDFVVLNLTTYIELSIGIICACLPSAHFLYERRKGAIHHGHDNRASSNRPRTGRWSSDASGPSSSWWSIRKPMRSLHLTTWVTNNATDTRTTSIDEERAPPMAEVQPPTATLRATRSCCRTAAAGDMNCCDESRRQAHRVFERELAQFTGEPVRDESDSPHFGSEFAFRCATSRANSMDGRREGWLAPTSGETTGLEGFPDIGPSSTRYWNSIWDGRVESILK